MARLVSKLGVVVDVADDLAETLRKQGWKPAKAVRSTRAAAPAATGDQEPVTDEE